MNDRSAKGAKKRVEDSSNQPKNASQNSQTVETPTSPKTDQRIFSKKFGHHNSPTAEEKFCRKSLTPPNENKGHLIALKSEILTAEKNAQMARTLPKRMTRSFLKKLILQFPNWECQNRRADFLQNSFYPKRRKQRPDPHENCDSHRHQKCANDPASPKTDERNFRKKFAHRNSPSTPEQFCKKTAHPTKRNRITPN